MTRRNVDLIILEKLINLCDFGYYLHEALVGKLILL